MFDLSFNDSDKTKQPNETHQDQAQNSKAKKNTDDAIQCVQYLNDLAGRKFLHEVNGRGAQNVRWAKSLLKIYDVEEVKTMIMYKCWQWKGDAKMEQYLRPQTLFKNNGKTYIDEALEARDNPAFQAVIKKAKAAENKSNGVFVAGEFTKRAVETLKNW